MSPKPKILIVDDEPLNVKLFAAILSSDSYEIIKAFNGEQALKKANEEFPDLILLDINLPDIDGYEVKKRLSSNHETQDIPIVAISANAMPEDIQKAKDAGFAHYLTKPININELLDTINSYVSNESRQK